jgi:hypothetical protein
MLSLLEQDSGLSNRLTLFRSAAPTDRASEVPSAEQALLPGAGHEHEGAVSGEKRTTGMPAADHWFMGGEMSTLPRASSPWPR